MLLTIVRDDVSGDVCGNVICDVMVVQGGKHRRC
jgi:hypothetical protein